MKPTPISWGHQKAVNWLYIEQQLFQNNYPLYLHPVPVPGVYNGSMYPKCLYPNEPAATQFKDLLFPSAGLPKESSPIRYLFFEKDYKRSVSPCPFCPHMSTGGVQKGHQRYK